MSNLTDSKTKPQRFAMKYGKKYGGNLTLEKAERVVLPKDLEESPSEFENSLVYLVGYIENPVAVVNKTGEDGRQVRTSFVVSLALFQGHLYAITKDKVYRLCGPWVFDTIQQDDILRGMWSSVSKKALQKLG